MPESQSKTVLGSRNPIVVVMGHIDHGKSTLLDYIRKTNTTASEAGGITQRVSAYEAEVELDGKSRKIIFLDTPGHEAFRAIRICGSKAADIGVLVVSAEEGVKPQTIEASECAKGAGIPFIVALNKIDKPNVNLNKTKQELAEAGIMVEGWGGTVPVVEISAKTGEGVNDLLATILLQSDLEGLVSDTNKLAEGFVLESHLDSRKGISATLIIRDGRLQKGMFVVSGTSIAPVRIMEDYRGISIDMAVASQPATIIGWSNSPEAGEPFASFDLRAEAESALKRNESRKLESETKNGAPIQNTATVKSVPIVIKSDAIGAIKALEHELKKLGNDKIAIRIISSGIGPINESDAKLALTSNEVIILGFRVAIDSRARDIITHQQVTAKTFEVIYDLVRWLDEEIVKRTPREQVEEITGVAKIIRVFSANKTKQIIGGSVESGEIKSGETVKIIRRDNRIGEGKIKEVQSQKIKTGKVTEGQEFGMMIDSKIEVAPGDRLHSIQKVER